jgi:hypothetical protein
LVLELVGFEVAGLLGHNVPGQIQHVLGDFDILDLVKILVRAADLVRIAQQRSDEPLLQRLERDDVLAVRQHHATDRDLVHFADGFSDHGERIVADLAVGAKVIGTDQVARVDLRLFNELVDVIVGNSIRLASEVELGDALG